MDTAKPEPTDVTIRQARREDVAGIAALIMQGAAKQTMTDAEIAAEAADPAYEEAFAAVLVSPDNTLFVAEQAGTVVGTFQITLIPGLVARGRKRAKIESVHVAPERRGQGIGAVMMRHAVDFARQHGVGLVELTSNKDRVDAHRFYRNFGFAQSHEGFKMEL
ncbi:GNAT family N-acetyltransferase [Bosea vaviloviae]|uniref:N-acetyltransferase domain-containing protein n=1 Tax=Bosea vaviloviae TaxID=1526658 RepID=A0A0N1FGL1_9HYPH|nr:GNAT family N-acetyltransferase [Bosea vaviloviae]KPH82160.1 hypothetical protein AE618_04380 [Bosea vaviloviae]